MTQREKFLALLAEFGITPEHDRGSLVLEANKGGVDGYQGFYAEFAFNADGVFEAVCVAE